MCSNIAGKGDDSTSDDAIDDANSSDAPQMPTDALNAPVAADDAEQSHMPSDIDVAEPQPTTMTALEPTNGGELPQPSTSLGTTEEPPQPTMNLDAHDDSDMPDQVPCTDQAATASDAPAADARRITPDTPPPEIASDAPAADAHRITPDTPPPETSPPSTLDADLSALFNTLAGPPITETALDEHTPAEEPPAAPPLRESTLPYLSPDDPDDLAHKFIPWMLGHARAAPGGKTILTNAKHFINYINEGGSHATGIDDDCLHYATVGSGLYAIVPFLQALASELQDVTFRL